MTLEEAIKHAEEVAENKEKAINLAKGNPDCPMLSMSEKGITEYKKCINEHRQLAEWLRELKRLKQDIENIQSEVRDLNRYQFPGYGSKVYYDADAVNDIIKTYFGGEGGE